MDTTNQPTPELLEVWYTTAPKSYDYGDVYELEAETAYYDRQGKNFRKIAVPVGKREYTLQRNASGLYATLTTKQVREQYG